METNEPVRVIEAGLQFDPAAESEEICAFIRAEVRHRGARGVVLGLSGGMDSAACAHLCARCLPRRQIHLFSLPERDSSPVLLERAGSVANTLGVPLVQRDLSPLVAELGIYDHISRSLAANRPLIESGIRLLLRLSGAPALFPWVQEYAFGRRRGLLAFILRRCLWRYAGQNEAFILGKVRARMLALSMQAARLDCLLVCTTDRSEWSIGFYDPHGDGAGDLAPLRHLYKTQIRTLAGFLGVNEAIIAQPSSGDLAAGLPNETAIGLRYEQLDRILIGLSLGLPEEEIAAAAGVRPRSVRGIGAACRLAESRRSLPVGVKAAE